VLAFSTRETKTVSWRFRRLEAALPINQPA
jgi:hypothetical protein